MGLKNKSNAAVWSIIQFKVKKMAEQISGMSSYLFQAFFVVAPVIRRTCDRYIKSRKNQCSLENVKCGIEEFTN